MFRIFFAVVTITSLTFHWSLSKELNFLIYHHFPLCLNCSIFFVHELLRLGRYVNIVVSKVLGKTENNDLDIESSLSHSISLKKWVCLISQKDIDSNLFHFSSGIIFSIWNFFFFCKRVSYLLLTFRDIMNNIKFKWYMLTFSLSNIFDVRLWKHLVYNHLYLSVNLYLPNDLF